MRYLAFLALLSMSAALVVSGLALKQRFEQGAKTRMAICRSENTLRKILHDEHETKLKRQQQFLRAHPNGIPGIPGDLIRQGIADERVIVRDTRPVLCR